MTGNILADFGWKDGFLRQLRALSSSFGDARGSKRVVFDFPEERLKVYLFNLKVYLLKFEVYLFEFWVYLLKFEVYLLKFEGMTL